MQPGPFYVPAEQMAGSGDGDFDPLEGMAGEVFELGVEGKAAVEDGGLGAVDGAAEEVVDELGVSAGGAAQGDRASGAGDDGEAVAGGDGLIGGRGDDDGAGGAKNVAEAGIGVAGGEQVFFAWGRGTEGVEHEAAGLETGPGAGVSAAGRGPGDVADGHNVKDGGGAKGAGDAVVAGEDLGRGRGSGLVAGEVGDGADGAGGGGVKPDGRRAGPVVAGGAVGGDAEASEEAGEEDAAVGFDFVIAGVEEQIVGGVQVEVLGEERREVVIHDDEVGILLAHGGEDDVEAAGHEALAAEGAVARGGDTHGGQFVAEVELEDVGPITADEAADGLSEDVEDLGLGEVEEVIAGGGGGLDDEGRAVGPLEHVIEGEAHGGGVFAAHDGGPETDAMAVGAEAVEELLEAWEAVGGVLERAVEGFPFVVDGEEAGLHAGGAELGVELVEEGLVEAVAGFAAGELRAPGAVLGGEGDGGLAGGALLDADDAGLDELVVVSGDGGAPGRGEGEEERGAEAEIAGAVEMVPEVGAVVDEGAEAAIAHAEEEVAVGQVGEAAGEGVGLAAGVETALRAGGGETEAGEVMDGQAPLLAEADRGAAAAEPDVLVEADGLAEDGADGDAFGDAGRDEKAGVEGGGAAGFGAGEVLERDDGVGGGGGVEDGVEPEGMLLKTQGQLEARGAVDGLVDNAEGGALNLDGADAAGRGAVRGGILRSGDDDGGLEDAGGDGAAFGVGEAKGIRGLVVLPGVGGGLDAEFSGGLSEDGAGLLGEGKTGGRGEKRAGGELNEEAAVERAQGGFSGVNP